MYLSDVKENFRNRLIIGDRGYVSEKFHTDLFNYSNMKFSYPIRENKHGFVEFSKTKTKSKSEKD